MATKDYDVAAAFQAIEYELINSFFRNMEKHRVDEVKERKEWEMWQVKQLQELDAYKRRNAKKYGTKFTDINKTIEEMLRLANEAGQMDQEAEILDAMSKGFKPQRPSEELTGQFFRTNDRKLDTLIDATVSDMERAEVAVLRKANDEYRKTIFNAMVYAASGAGTYEKAVDMATKDFARAGIQCIEYKNGTKHTISDYADMAIRTANTRAYLQGEGAKRQEWGVHTVIVNKRLNACPHCMPFAGKVFIDDVWGGGTAADGNYPLLSEAVAAGLYHPRCKDSHTAFFPGISDRPKKYTRAEVKEAEKAEEQERKADYAERQAEKCQRLADTRLDPENKRLEQAKANKWDRNTEDIKENGDVQYLRNNLPRGYSDKRTIGEKISKESLNSFLDKAASLGIRIGADPNSTGNFEEYRGDLAILDEILEHLADNLRIAKENGLLKADDDIILVYDNVLGYEGDKSVIDIGAFAQTKGKTITISKFMFDSEQFLEDEYKDALEHHLFPKGTTIKNIVDHEFGHIIDNRNPFLKKRILAILQKEAADANMKLEEYIFDRISGYAAQADENGEYTFCELVSEMYNMCRGDSGEYAASLFQRAGVRL